MKFNLFDESTWQNNKKNVDPEIQMRNKVLGHMGNAMRDVHDLRRKIEKLDQLDSEDYKISEVLRSRNFEAYKLMEVSVEFADANIKYILEQIDTLIKFWGDKDSREHTYKQHLNLFRNLAPYLKDDYSFGSSYSIRDANITNLATVKVKGNAAWKVYLEAAKSRNYYIDKYSSLQDENEKLKAQLNPEEDEDCPSSRDYCD